MYPCFDIDGISLERLLSEWKWLAPGAFSLLAVNAFGDLFLMDVHGSVQRLDVTGGTICEVANSEEEFRFAADAPSKKKEWLLMDEEDKAGRKGYSAGKGQCVGSKIPWIFKESASMPDNLYVADLYEYVSFMGDLHSQIHSVPDGGQVRVKIQPRPDQADPSRTE